MNNELNAKIDSCRAMLDRLDLKAEEDRLERVMINNYLAFCIRMRDECSKIPEPIDNPHKHFQKIKLRKDSFAYKCRELLLEKGIPMHIDTIAKLLHGENVPRGKVDQLRGNLNGLCSQLRVFTRDSPGIYGLMEWVKHDS